MFTCTPLGSNWNHRARGYRAAKIAGALPRTSKRAEDGAHATHSGPKTEYNWG